MVRDVAAIAILTGAACDDVELFAQLFLEWCVTVGKTGTLDWSYVKMLAAEFAEYENLVVPSDMKLSKALSCRGVTGRMRYLKPGEVGYRSATKRGVKRPRIRELHIGVIAQRRFQLVN